MDGPVFISHASGDREAAGDLCRALEAAGVPCWLAFRDIAPGASYSGAILEAIGNSRAMIVVVSTRTEQSQHVVREVERAVNRNIPLLPVRVDDSMPRGDLEYFLSAVQWTDAFPALTDDVVRRLAQRVGPASAEAAPPAADPLVDIRRRGLAAGNVTELRRVFHEAEAHFKAHPNADAAILLGDLQLALNRELIGSRPMYALDWDPRPAARSGRRQAIVATAVLALIAIAALSYCGYHVL